ncbi:hypothetical protein N9F71_00370 [bacterium]|nr:hypothetical protein [bacterium]MDB4435728.1 hypothetical protein [bacterium]
MIVITDKDIALNYVKSLYDITAEEAESLYEDEIQEAIRLQKLGLVPWVVKDDKPEPDWTDDEFYEGAWSWVDECEVDEEDKDEAS